MNKEIYLDQLEWTKAHDNIGRIKGIFIIKDKMSCEDCQTLFSLNNDFVLCSKDYITNLQENTNKAIHLLEQENNYCPSSLTLEKSYIIEVEKINKVLSILKGSEE